MGRLATTVFGVALLASCAAYADDDAKLSTSPPPATIKIDIARGDRWIYEIRDDITDELKIVTDYTVTEVTDSEIDTRVRYTNIANNNSETTGVQTFDLNWHTKDNGTVTFRPGLEDVGVPADLHLGKTWSYKYETMRVRPLAHFSFVGKAKVDSWEHVVVGNGLAFDAFKIVYESSVFPVVNNRKFTSRVELWYAPAANRYVKRKYESRMNGKLADASEEILRDYRRRK